MVFDRALAYAQISSNVLARMDVKSASSIDRRCSPRLNVRSLVSAWELKGCPQSVALSLDGRHFCVGKSSFAQKNTG